MSLKVIFKNYRWSIICLQRLSNRRWG